MEGKPSSYLTNHLILFDLKISCDIVGAILTSGFGVKNHNLLAPYGSIEHGFAPNFLVGVFFLLLSVL